jgi:serine/threonine-protein kinase
MSVPSKIGKYEIVKPLGEGAMGIVLKARDLKIARDVAIKTIHKHLLDGDVGDEVKQRFIHEVRAVGQLRHPNIVAIYETDDYFEEGEDTPIPYFVMEYVEGKELEGILKAGERFSQARAIDIVRQVLLAFDYTHGHGIIHRDIKPANIFITPQGEVKIADFGIARIENSELTQMGSVLGTPNYMSPEQCAGQAIDNRSDLFSIGIVFYELLTGEKPFQGNSMHAVMHKIVNTIPDAPSLMNPVISDGLDAVLLKALAKRPDDRYQTAGEFLAAVMAAVGENGTQVGGQTLGSVISHGVSQLGAFDSAAESELAQTAVQSRRSVTDSDETVVVAQGVTAVGLGSAHALDAAAEVTLLNPDSAKASAATVAMPGEDQAALAAKTQHIDALGEQGGQSQLADRVATKGAPITFVLLAVLVCIITGAAVYYYFNWRSSDGEVLSGESDFGAPLTPSQRDNEDISADAIKAPAAILTDEQVAKVQKLLRVAEINEKTGRLVWPPTSNAVYVYRLAMEIDPDNNKARQALSRIAAKLIATAEELDAKADIEALSAHLEVSLQSFPRNRRLLALQEKISQGPK